MGLALLGLWGCGTSETEDRAAEPVSGDGQDAPADASGAVPDVEDVTPAEDVGAPEEVLQVEPIPGCVEDTDCAYLVAGLAPCEVARCEAEACVSAALPDGDDCDDADPCTSADVCQGGVCDGQPIQGCISDEVAERDVVIAEVHFDGADNALRTEFVELYNYTDSPIDLSGWVLEQGVHFALPEGTIIAPGGYVVVSEDPATLLGVFGAESLGPYTNNLSSGGERLILRDAQGEVADEVSFKVGYPWPVGSGGTGSSMELILPQLDNDLGGSWRASMPNEDGVHVPTPGAPNSVATFNAPPQSRQVVHTPQSPTATDEVIVSVKVTDPQGVGPVSLSYQVVSPGAYVPYAFPVPLDQLEDEPGTPMALNPAYSDPANWVTVEMNDAGLDGDTLAGDNRYAVTLPVQGNRTLVRYRIRVEDAVGEHVTVPYEDDASRNFAYYVYDGVPDYGDHPAEVLETLPVYTLISRPEDVLQVMAYNGYEQFSQQQGGSANEARSTYNWAITLVYDGVVYDNIRWRLRGSYGRYQHSGKRSFRFRFNRGHWLVAKDALGEPYAEPWRTLTTGKGFENRSTLTYDLNCVVNNHLMRSVGVPAPYWHWFHLRVVDGVDEAPDPWTGDFWGLHSATETYDKRFLDSHGLPKGNLYKLVYAKSAGLEQRRYQAPDGVSDGSDHDNIEQNVTGNSTAAYIRAHVHLPEWYAYHTVAEAVRHYDFWPAGNKNQVYYFWPDYTADNSYYGKLWVLPWDSDSSWGPTWFNGHDVVYNALYNGTGGGSDNATTPELHHEYQNVIREVRDLLWQPDQIEPLIDRVAAPIMAFTLADRERWTGGPPEAGTYAGLGGAGMTSVAALAEDMKAFAFVGGSWPGGGSAGSPGGGPIGPGGRAAHLDALHSADGEGGRIPDTPVVTYVGDPEYPANGLSFETDVVADPQVNQDVTAIAWRIALDGGPVMDPTVPINLEIQALWESEPMPGNSGSITIPLGVATADTTYRVRARALDPTGRWSHWSAPVVFTAGPAVGGASDLTALRLTEVMYNPAPPPKSSPHDASDFEFMEFRNTGTTPLDLGNAALAGGITMAFPVGTVLEPDTYLVVARNPEAFVERYTTGLATYGPYDGRLSNGGESVSLMSGGEVIQTWTYDDKGGWPTRADGLGCSIEAPDWSSDLDLPASWRASSELHGSPGWTGFGPAPTPVINEVAAWWGGAGTWEIELHNPTDEPLDIGGWWLGQAPDYDAFVIPEGTIVPAGSHMMLGANGVVTLPVWQGDSGLWLVEPGFVVRLHDQVSHSAWSDGEAWGRWPDGTGPMMPMEATTLGAPNAGPRIGPLVISEIMAVPADVPEDFEPNDLEYIEVYNPTYAPEQLGGWMLSGGVDMSFAAGTWIAGRETLVVVPWDPDLPGNASRLEVLRAHYGMSAATSVVGGYDGSLSDGGEALSLWRSMEDGDLSLEDGVAYGDAAFDNGTAPASGLALHRQGAASVGLDGASWIGDAPSPGAVTGW